MRKFIHHRRHWDEISEINEQTGDIKNYCKDREDGTIFRVQTDNIFRIGWESVPKFIQARRSKAWGYQEKE